MIANVSYDGKSYSLEYDILAPGIYVYRNVFPQEWNLVQRIEDALKIPGTPYSWQPANVSYSENVLSQRNCYDFKVNEKTLGQPTEFNKDLYVVHDQIIGSLKAIMNHYAPENNVGQISYYECINIVRYGKGEFFKVHTDDGEPYRCTVSAVGYPNDNYVGGELFFKHFNITYKPKAGDFVLFPSAYSYAHSSEPVLDEGTKYSFVIMTDRTEFAHRADSPIYYDKEYRLANGAKG